MLTPNDPSFRAGGAAVVGDGLLDAPTGPTPVRELRARVRVAAPPSTLDGKVDLLIAELRALRAELASRTLLGRLRRLGVWLRRHLWRW